MSQVEKTSDDTVNKGLCDFSRITKEWLAQAKIEIANDAIQSLEDNEIKLTESLSNVINDFMK